MNFNPEQLNQIIVHQAAQVMASQQLAEHNAQLCNQNKAVADQNAARVTELIAANDDLQRKVEGLVSALSDILGALPTGADDETHAFDLACAAAVKRIKAIASAALIDLP